MHSPKQKTASLRHQFNPQKAYPSPTSLPSPEVAQFQEFARIPHLALDHYSSSSAWSGLGPGPPPPPPMTTHCAGVVMSEYFHHAGSSLTGDVYGLDFARSGAIHSERSLELTGPLDVAGTITARSIGFDGDFIVSDAIYAYGSIEINGNMTAEIEGSSRLKLCGSIHAADVEIYGNVTLRGYLCCRRLVVYGSLILIGPNSTYEVAGYEMITGSRTRRDHEPDWDI
ncbi:hypothetical protein CRV24_008068 [Beauveria bassiana]|nr:hypothetical protein CRV24_008068 [Beauveria bassiana]